MLSSKFIFTALGQVIRFDIEKTRTQGRTTRGVRGIKRQEVVGAGVEVRVQDLDDGLHRICRNRLVHCPCLYP